MQQPVPAPPPQQGALTRLSRMLQPNLPLAEISISTAGWIFSVCYSIYHVFLASRVYYRTLAVHELEVGWFGPISTWRKDVSDSEWNEFSALLFQSWPWLVMHFAGSQVLRKANKAVIPLFWASLGMIYAYKLLGSNGLLYLLAQPLLFFIVSKLGSSKLVYLVAMWYMAGNDFWPLKDLQAMAFTPEQYRIRYFASVTNSWMNARALSFCLDHLWGEVPSEGFIGDLINLLAHCFYLPTCISGPIVNFKDFRKGLKAEAMPWTAQRARTFVFTVARYSFWFFINDLLLHAFYFSALQYDYEILEKVNMWTLAGIGYSMGQFFHMKYTVFYGMPGAFLTEDHVEAPSPPKCIGRIHLYSDMWRFFDNGLYKFLRKYFYQPLLNPDRRSNFFIRLLASTATFAFVYIWHGTREHVLIWSVLNFTGITLEAAAREVGAWPAYARLERRVLSLPSRRRFYSLLGAPLFLMSILSNFYFFMGTEVGHLFVKRMCWAWPLGTPITLLFMYCGAQTSFEVRNWEIRARLRQGLNA